jgi:carboxypeptidase Taq
MQEEDLKRFHEWQMRLSAYQMALTIIEIDKSTVAPSGGSAYRDERTAILDGEYYSLAADESIYQLLQKMAQDESLDHDTRRAASLYAKDMSHTLCIPKDEYVAYSRLLASSYNVWLQAKKRDDYHLFAPVLKDVIAARKKLIGYRGSSLPLYDQLLDDYEPGMNMARYDAFFVQVKERLVPLIQAVVKAEPIDDSFLYRNYPADGQKAFMQDLLRYLHFDPSWGYQNETEHPFTAWTCAGDCRTTTKYLPDNVISAILSTVHETGHAWYRHQIDPKYDGSILAEGVSCGMHESQSRLCENLLGRRRSFWSANYPGLVQQFPQQLGGVSLDAFVRGINASRPTLVRTEADELTYPMHIVIRYEMEKGMFDGSIDIDHLDEAWNDMYQKYLGIHAEKASEGILQDVHWADGDFGYFPTYALGSAYASQFMAAMEKDIDVDEALADSRYDICMAWLKTHVHQYGCAVPSEEVLQKATGEEFNPSYYLDYLEKKYTELYRL